MYVFTFAFPYIWIDFHLTSIMNLLLLYIMPLEGLIDDAEAVVSQFFDDQYMYLFRNQTVISRLYLSGLSKINYNTICSKFESNSNKISEEKLIGGASIMPFYRQLIINETNCISQQVRGDLCRNRQQQREPQQTLDYPERCETAVKASLLLCEA